MPLPYLGSPAPGIERAIRSWRRRARFSDPCSWWAGPEPASVGQEQHDANKEPQAHGDHRGPQHVRSHPGGGEAPSADKPNQCRADELGPRQVIAKPAISMERSETNEALEQVRPASDPVAKPATRGPDRVTHPPNAQPKTENAHLDILVHLVLQCNGAWAG